MTDNQYFENKVLLNDMIKRNWISKMQDPTIKTKLSSYTIEFFLTDVCAQNCEYCYLKKHQQELYPIEIQNFSKIIENFQLLINWYIDNNLLCDIDLFSGEWITTSLMEPIFTILYNSFEKIPEYKRPNVIILADNMSFIENDEITAKVQHFIDLFASINIRLCFSASIDGKYCDNGRKQHDDIYYQKLFAFLEKNEFYAHPMISSSNIKYWKQNYLWWDKNCPSNMSITDFLMTLEVRDHTWDEESISEFIDYCNFLIDFKLYNDFHNDIIAFTKYIFRETQSAYMPIQFFPPEVTYHNRDDSACHFSHAFSVRVGDLKIGMCHRTFYKEFEIGQFNVENNKITDINPLHIECEIVKDHLKRSCLPHCDNCSIVGVCMGYCLGEAYEDHKNLLVPTYENCQLQKAKIAFLIQKYNELGVFDVLDKTDLTQDVIKYILELKKYILEKSNIKDEKL